eukprot:2536883-Prymnesium_polylepis.2
MEGATDKRTPESPHRVAFQVDRLTLSGTAVTRARRSQLRQALRVASGQPITSSPRTSGSTFVESVRCRRLAARLPLPHHPLLDDRLPRRILPRALPAARRPPGLALLHPLPYPRPRPEGGRHSAGVGRLVGTPAQLLLGLAVAARMRLPHLVAVPVCLVHLGRRQHRHKIVWPPSDRFREQHVAQPERVRRVARRGGERADAVDEVGHERVAGGRGHERICHRFSVSLVRLCRRVGEDRKPWCQRQLLERVEARKVCVQVDAPEAVQIAVIGVGPEPKRPVKGQHELGVRDRRGRETRPALHRALQHRRPSERRGPRESRGRGHELGERRAEMPIDCDVARRARDGVPD